MNRSLYSVLMNYLGNIKRDKLLIAGMLWLGLVSLAYGASSEELKSRLELARENLRISEATEAHIAFELENLNSSENVSPELIKDYKAAHAAGAAWPEITQGMKDVGILDMEIYLDGTSLIMIMDVVPEFDHEMIYSISPNPCSGTVYIRFKVGKAQTVSCDLIDISGIRIKELISEVKSSGIHEIKIDLSDLKPGIYFCTLKTNKGMQTKKIIKL